MNKKKEKSFIYTTPRPGHVIPCLSTLSPFYRKPALVQPWSWALGAVSVFTPQDALIALGDQPTNLNALRSALPVLYAGYNTDKTSERKKKPVKLGPSYRVLTAQVRQRKPSGNCCVQARESSFTNSFFDSCFVLKLPSHENMLFVAYSSNPFPLPSDFHVVTGSFSWSWELHEAPWFRRASQSLGKGWHKKVMKLCIQIPELPAPNLSLSY